MALSPSRLKLFGLTFTALQTFSGTDTFPAHRTSVRLLMATLNGQHPFSRQILPAPSDTLCSLTLTKWRLFTMSHYQNVPQDIR